MYFVVEILLETLYPLCIRTLKMMFLSEDFSCYYYPSETAEGIQLTIMLVYLKLSHFFSTCLEKGEI